MHVAPGLGSSAFTAEQASWKVSILSAECSAAPNIAVQCSAVQFNAVKSNAVKINAVQLTAY